MSKKFRNSKTISFLKSFEDLVSLDDDNCDLSVRSKINFSFFDNSQEFSGKFSDWDKETICIFFDKIIEYGKKSLGQMQTIGLGKRRIGMLSFYDSFPSHSRFTCPKNIPHQVRWGRFRLDSDKRLVGFIVPDEYHGQIHKKTGVCYDKNTFYVVFIDNEHKFYPLS